MKIQIVENYKEMSRAAADIFSEDGLKVPSFFLSLFSGKSPQGG